MKSHKKHSPEHDYCSKCDEDFETDADLMMHKAFRPDMHDIACRICGEEYKTPSGMKRHVNMTHPQDQKIPCIGCGEVFRRPSILTSHLETGQCDKISPHIFYGSIVHKYLVKRLLANPNGERDRFIAKIGKHDAAYDTEDSGGIELDDNSAKEWPRLQARDESNATTDGTDHLASVLSGITLNAVEGGEGVPGGSRSSTEVGQASSRSEQTSPPSAWGQNRDGRDTAKILFPKAPPNPMLNGRYGNAQDTEEEGINLFKTRFWDPTSADYKPERFYDPATGEYHCPFICEQKFTTDFDLEAHILNGHRITKMRCPRCMKKFGSATALIAHCENVNSKCGISEAEDFAEFLDRLSGGFLDAKVEVRPDHLFNPSVMVANEDGQIEPYIAPTVTYVKYTATRPIEWNPDSKKTIKIDRR
jgi:hypothetical protein